MDLRTQRKYRIYLEEAHNAKELESWRFYEMRGFYGTIWPYSQTHLACLILSNRIGERIRREKPHWKLIQNGDNEMCFKLENKFIEEAAEVIRAKKKRRMTPEQKEKLVEMGRKHHFKSKTNGDKAEFKQI